MLSKLDIFNFHKAINNGDIDLVKLIVKKTPEIINAKTRDNVTPLDSSLYNYKPEITAFLIENGAEFGAINNPLSFNNPEATQLLIDKGFTLQTQDKDEQIRIFFDSIRNNNEILARYIIEQNPEIIEAISYYNETPLSAAMYSASPEIINLLIDHGADLNKINNPLSLTTGNPEATQLLIDKGFSLKRMDEEELTKIFFNCIYGSHKYGSNKLLIERIIEQDPKVINAKQYGQTPLALALSYVSPEVIDLLIDHGADLSAIKNPLSLTASNPKVTQFLIDKGFSLKEMKETELTELFSSSIHNHNEILAQQIIKQDPNVIDIINTRTDLNTITYGSPTPLNEVIAPAYSTRKGSEKTAKFLIEKGARATIKDYYLSIIAKLPEITQILVDKGIKPDIKSAETIKIFHDSARAGNAALVDLLINNGVDINARDELGNTPLVSAMQANYVFTGMVESLIYNGADLNMPNKDGESPIAIAIRTKNTFIAALLIDNGADIDIKSLDAINLFHDAISQGNIELVKLLIDQKIDINATENSKSGKTPLMMAIRSNQPKIFNLLVDSGADINMPGRDGKTALDVAISSNQLEIAKFLKQNMSKKISIARIRTILAKKTIDESFTEAKKRYQPYLNLANQVHSLRLLSSEETFKKYKEMDLKSLYLRTDNITLNKELADFLTKLTENGIREVVIFGDKETSELSTEAFNDFARDNKIRINLKVVPITQEDLVNIENDSIGGKDILGFAKLHDHEIFYQDGYSIALLNDAETSQIILDNYAEYKKQISERHQFTVQEPEYITDNNDPNAEHRIKDPAKAKKSLNVETEFQISTELNTNIDLQAQIAQELENDLDLDLEQAENKFDRNEAISKSYEIMKKLFSEENIILRSNTDSPDIYNIFDSNPNINYITEKALVLVIKNRFVLKYGIDPNNLPIGLAFKDGIIFASDQRLASMPVNELTPKLNPIAPGVSNPLEYSWLQYASKASLTPDDLYGSEIAPEIRGSDGYPYSQSYYATKDKLDYPIALGCVAYNVDPITQYPSFSSSIHPYLLINVPKERIKQGYHGISFSSLSEQDKSRIDVIYNNLDARGITVGFNRIIQNSILSNGDFLLEERTALFLDKLFKEILPIPGDIKKLEFFKDITSDCQFINSYLEEVYEGLNGFYSKFQEFLLNQEIEGEHRAKVISKIKEIVKVQAGDGIGLKTLMGRLVNTLDYTASKGGSLYEQLEYLKSSGLLGDPKILHLAKELELNVVYKSAQLGEISDDIYTKAIRDLSAIAPYARSGLDIYDQYYASGAGNVDYILGEKTDDYRFLKKANGDMKILQILLDEYNNSPEKDYQFTHHIKTSNTDLLTNFTVEQAQQNIRLLTLNMHSSSGKHYDITYPTQEFESYVSLFGTLFSEVKIYNDIKVGDRKYVAGEDYNRQVLTAAESTIRDALDPNIEVKQNQHKQMIDNFTNLYEAYPEFNFAQVVALGLVSNFKPDIANKVISKAKTLTQYKEYLSQFLRITLATPITSEIGLAELNAKAEAIARNINYLFVEHDGRLIYEILTDNGVHPENLAFFASCFAKDPDITYDKVINLVERLNSLDDNLKQELLHSFAHTKLPFDHGEIISNNFPQISLEILSDPIAIQDVIVRTKDSQISYQAQSRFNDVSLDTRENAVIDLEPVAKKYMLDLPIELKGKNYKEIKKYISHNKNFVQVTLAQNTDNPELVKNISKDLLKIMFKEIAVREMSFERITDKTIDLLFDPSKSLDEQFYALEYKKRALDSLFKKLDNQLEREGLLNSLLKDPQLPKDKLGEILFYLNELDLKKLALKNYTMTKLISEAGNKFITEHFDAFKITTEFFIKSKSIENFQELRELVLQLANAKYSNLHIKKIITYALENNDYRTVDILSKLNGKAANIDKVVNFLTKITPADLNLIDQTLGIKNLIKLQDINKITIIAKIALKFGSSIDQVQYQELIKQTKQHNLNYAKLVKSYLLTTDTKNFSKADKIKLVFGNIATPEKIQTILAQNNLNRFEHNPERVKGKIGQILRLNTDDNSPIPLKQQAEIYSDLTTILNQAKAYNSMNPIEIMKEAIRLKHERSLAKDNEPEKIKELDLKFLAISCNTMYRETGMFPRDTQMLSALNTITQQGHIIEEIPTGQGKGLITALHAAYLAYTGQTVDVATSDQKLAQRDLEEFTPFYESLGIKVANNIITAGSDASEYKKSGINYGVASDLALARANREFFSNTAQVSLNADVSLICDEVDFTLTSEVNYILAVSLIKTTQEETRSLLKYVIEFSETEVFKNDKLSKKDDVANLELFLNNQFAKYDSSYKYPLGPVQLDALKKNADPQAQQLYLLHKAMSKVNKYKETIFDKLLDSAVLAKTLELGKDYVILQENLDNKDTLLQVTPIIKSQPGRKTMFGEGVQASLHLLIEQQYPELQGRFDVSLPASTIFNINPKNFFDYYRMTGGRIIGLTGTAGSMYELEEFRESNKMLSYSIPQYEDDKKLIKHEEVKDALDQHREMMKILDDTSPDRPAIIFCQTPQEAQSLYQELKSYRTNVQLADPSNKPEDIKASVDRSGKLGYITITTSMLGRGTDFSTNYAQGFLGINLCTDITINDLRQLEGRVGRNGQEGTFVSLFNKEQFGADIHSHMIDIAKSQREKRIKSQPPADILQFFNTENQDSQINAIRSNELIQQAWSKLVKENSELSTDRQKSYIDLRTDLVAILEKKYPAQIEALNKYLKQLDDCVPTKAGEMTCQMSAHYVADYTTQDYSQKGQYVIDSQNYPSLDWSKISQIAKSTPIDQIEVPSLDSDDSYKIFYNAVFKAQAATMATHAFSIKDNKFKITYDYNHEIKIGAAVDRVANLFIEDGKLYYQMKDKDLLELPIGNIPKDGIPQSLYRKIITALEGNSFVELTSEEKERIKEFAIHKNYLKSDIIGGEGSSSTLMVDEFKHSFKEYQNYQKIADSAELKKIANLIDNLGNIQNIDMSKLEYSKYQAMEITTKFDTSASHAESILTDGKFLLWANRGGGADGEPGIKLFKITKDIQSVQAILNSLKNPVSQAETREKIYGLLKDDSDKSIPKYVLIDLPAQTVGNCGWTQTESLLKAAAVVGRMGDIDELPNPKSKEWQKALKDSDDIYQDWFNFDQVQRLETMLFTKDANFIPQFLDQSDQQKINARRDILETPISHDLLKNTLKSFVPTIARFEGTIYESRIQELLDIMHLEVVVDSEMGKALQWANGRGATKDLLLNYQQNNGNEFKQLEDFFEKTITTRIQDKSTQTKLLEQVIKYITTNDIDNIETLFKSLDSSINPLNQARHNEQIRNNLSDAISKGDIVEILQNGLTATLDIKTPQEELSLIKTEKASVPRSNISSAIAQTVWDGNQFLTENDPLKISGGVAVEETPSIAPEDQPTTDSNNQSELPNTKRKSSKKHSIDSDDSWLLKTKYYSNDISKLNEIFTKYSIEGSVDILRDDSKFRRLVLTKLHPDKGGNTEDFRFVQDLKEKFDKDLDVNAVSAENSSRIQTMLNQANVAFKVADTAIDVARLVNEPTVAHAKKVALDTAHLASMHYGFSGYSTAVGAADVLSKVAQGQYRQAATSALTSAAYMVAPHVIGHIGAQLGVPYLDTAYSSAMTTYTGYNMLSNAYSLYQEYGSEESKQRSVKAYSDLAQALSKTPLQRVYDFSSATDKTSSITAISDLHLAASKGETEKIKALIKDGADINSVDKLGSTPLHIAILRKKTETIRSLIELGADVNAINNKNLSPLHLATMFGDNDETIKILLKAGAKLSEEDRAKYPQYFGEKAITELLKEAIDNNDLKSIKNLFKHHEQFKDKFIDDSGGTLLSYAVARDRPEIVSYLVDDKLKLQKTDLVTSNPQETRGVAAKDIDREIMLTDDHQQLMQEIKAAGKAIHTVARESTTVRDVNIQLSRNNPRKVDH